MCVVVWESPLSVFHLAELMPDAFPGTTKIRTTNKN